ncbi:3-hydroxyacyl-CoA dehydrogenase family protein [Nocardioides hwasunensis]|uniref:3-hydroxyacyl-CoA dehydrogenase family protein n=1 Tax=Nocardioides hwasunensis TaxID=397258 RepID=A0ABR8MN97_9ACTN|nr:3-hydroxyacyl-CoA dehydrogenase family protein [Nocardioides hwasunensis]MBD3917035.1 3-hydroxyacyl-CoA dehydrogenase family protein [Nocardioides hwasunensis]
MTDLQRVAVIGGGVMGNGIAQLSAMKGHDVRLVDVSQERLDSALASIGTSLDRFVKSGKLDAGDRADVLDRLRTTTSVADAVSDVDLVVEAVLERLDVKQAVLAEVVAHAPVAAVLGTNTSQLSITAIASALGDEAHRVVGMHFFNPAVLMRLVELVVGLETSPETLARAEAYAASLGKETVVCRKDSPGFLTSRFSAILRMEALHMLEEGLATPEDIDKAVKLAFNHPMGPLELGDFNGLDTYLDALTGLHAAHGERFRPPVELKNMVAAGRLGRKSGRGFYDHSGS